jgi:hypothetical protein
MRLNLRGLTLILIFAATCLASAFSQKVNVGYDKGVKFSDYKTYQWVTPSAPPSKPILYESIVGAIDYELNPKGLTRVDNDGDLVLIPVGGMEFGINYAVGTPILATYGGPPLSLDANMWTGSVWASNLLAPYVPEGTLALDFIDRATNKLVWSGTVKQKLDVRNKSDSLDQIDKAIVKLLKEYPPKKK